MIEIQVQDNEQGGFKDGSEALCAGGRGEQ